MELEDEYWHLDRKLARTTDAAARRELSDRLDELLDEILFIEEEIRELKVQCKEPEAGVGSDHVEGRTAGGSQDW